MINELIASVDKVLGQVSPDAPTSQPAPACECPFCGTEYDCDSLHMCPDTQESEKPLCECEAPATVNFMGIDLCADCYNEYRSHWGIKPFDEGGNWSGRL